MEASDWIGLESKMPASDPFGCAQGKKRALQTARVVAQWMRLGAGYGDARLSVRYMDLGVTDSAWGGTAVLDELRAGI